MSQTESPTRDIRADTAKKAEVSPFSRRDSSLQHQRILHDHSSNLSSSYQRADLRYVGSLEERTTTNVWYIQLALAMIIGRGMKTMPKLAGHSYTDLRTHHVTSLVGLLVALS